MFVYYCVCAQIYIHVFAHLEKNMDSLVNKVVEEPVLERDNVERLRKMTCGNEECTCMRYTVPFMERLEFRGAFFESQKSAPGSRSSTLSLFDNERLRKKEPQDPLEAKIERFKRAAYLDQTNVGVHEPDISDKVHLVLKQYFDRCRKVYAYLKEIDQVRQHKPN